MNEDLISIVENWVRYRSSVIVKQQLGVFNAGSPAWREFTDSLNTHSRRLLAAYPQLNQELVDGLAEIVGNARQFVANRDSAFVRGN